MQVCTTPTATPISPALTVRYHIADHSAVWPDIAPGLEELHAAHAEQDWSPLSVRQMLDDDMAVLLVDDDDPTAFAVVFFGPYPYNIDHTELNVFLVWHKGGNAIEKFQPHLEVFARLGGAKYMRFYSRRAAFLRVAQRAGYELRGIEYVKELQHG